MSAAPLPAPPTPTPRSRLYRIVRGLLALLGVVSIAALAWVMWEKIHNESRTAVVTWATESLPKLFDDLPALRGKIGNFAAAAFTQDGTFGTEKITAASIGAALLALLGFLRYRGRNATTPATAPSWIRRYGVGGLKLVALLGGLTLLEPAVVAGAVGSDAGPSMTNWAQGIDALVGNQKVQDGTRGGIYGSLLVAALAGFVLVVRSQSVTRWDTARKWAGGLLVATIATTATTGLSGLYWNGAGREVSLPPGSKWLVSKSEAELAETEDKLRAAKTDLATMEDPAGQLIAFRTEMSKLEADDGPLKTAQAELATVNGKLADAKRELDGLTAATTGKIAVAQAELDGLTTPVTGKIAVAKSELLKLEEPTGPLQTKRAELAKLDAPMGELVTKRAELAKLTGKDIPAAQLELDGLTGPKGKLTLAKDDLMKTDAAAKKLQLDLTGLTTQIDVAGKQLTAITGPGGTLPTAQQRLDALTGPKGTLTLADQRYTELTRKGGLLDTAEARLKTLTPKAGPVPAEVVPVPVVPAKVDAATALKSVRASYDSVSAKRRSHKVDEEFSPAEVADLTQAHKVSDMANKEGPIVTLRSDATALLALDVKLKAIDARLAKLITDNKVQPADKK